jgi:hypothetical protein
MQVLLPNTASRSSYVQSAPVSVGRNFARRKNLPVNVAMTKAKAAAAITLIIVFSHVIFEGLIIDLGDLRSDLRLRHAVLSGSFAIPYAT